MLDLVPHPAMTRAAAPATEASSSSSLRVLKFGGSSLATPGRIRRAARIVDDAARSAPTVVVVSAFHGTTNALLECAQQAQHDAAAAMAACDAIAARHRTAANIVLGRDDRVTRACVARQLCELRDVLRGITLLGCCPPAALDSVASFGERLSATIVAGHLNRFRPARFVDARDFVATDDQFTRAAVDLSVTNRAARDYFTRIWDEAPSLVAVVTGFIGRSPAGRTTTIGRNGSDYTAAIVGAALDAAVIEIWTDVDGVLTGDPKTTPSPLAIPEITYDDALEMSHAGANVLHPSTIGPAVAKSIPIVVKNTLNPSAAGTRICAARTVPATASLCGSVTSMSGLTLLTLRGGDRSTGRSHAARVSHALASRGIDVVLGSHACSELSISVAVRDAAAAAAVEALRLEFCFELERGFATLIEFRDRVVVTVVGAGGTEGAAMAGAVFGVLGRQEIPLRAFSQGTSARSVSCVIDAADRTRAVRVIHRELFERDDSLAVAVFGAGQVGSALLDELSAWRAKGAAVKVVAIANSRRAVFCPEGVNLVNWRETLGASVRPTDPCGIADAIKDLAQSRAALVDCTAGLDIVETYERFARADCHIVTPNKRAGVLPLSRYTQLRDALAARRRLFLDSTTVGAGLPVLAAIRDLRAGGGAIRRIEGMLSGTLGYLFSSFDGDVPFSALVRRACEAGLTEPDPREDLAGDDVRRKLLILAREAGLPLELDDVSVESLLEADDDALRDRVCRARARGSVLRYVARIENGAASAGLQEIPRDHPLAALSGCDNVVAVTSDRHTSPLVIRGPGAGAALTAKALVADLARLL